jgi:hypothetical protein
MSYNKLHTGRRVGSATAYLIACYGELVVRPVTSIMGKGNYEIMLKAIQTLRGVTRHPLERRLNGSESRPAREDGVYPSCFRMLESRPRARGQPLYLRSSPGSWAFV